MSTDQKELDAMLEQKLRELTEYRQSQCSSFKNFSKKGKGGSKEALTSWLTLDAEQGTPEGLDPADDLKRELSFYQQAVESAKRFVSQLPRKEDFFPPAGHVPLMVKSVQHMTKVKDKVECMQREAIERNKARKQRELKKVNKDVERQVLEERRGKTKEALAIIERKRKAEPSADDDFNVLVEEDADPDELARAAQQLNKKHRTERGRMSGGKAGAAKPSMSRQTRDAKYGYSGGQKKGRFAKSNTRDSTDDISGFNARKNKSLSFGKHFSVKGKGGSRTGGKPSHVTKGGNRPGKARRAKTHQQPRRSK